MELIYICTFLLFLYIIKNLYNKVSPKKKLVTIGAFGFVLKFISLLINRNISDIKISSYNDILDKLLINLDKFNKKRRVFVKIDEFEEIFWKTLTNGKYYNYHKELVDFLLPIANNDYKKASKYIFLKFYRLPFILYKIISSSSTYLEVINKLVLIETLTKAYQISSIMNVDLETSIKKMRLVRNIKIYDTKLKIRMISRQARSPMYGSEPCPFIKYVKKCKISKNIINYSILIIENNIFFTFSKIECKEHKSCIYYRDKNMITKHLDEWNFWKYDDYWINKYPHEREILI
jgi:hypothetical protein